MTKVYEQEFEFASWLEWTLIRAMIVQDHMDRVILVKGESCEYSFIDHVPP